MEGGTILVLNEGVSMSDGGKGSWPRPFSVSDAEYAQRWDAIFARDKNEECKHDVWTHDGDTYVCLKCFMKADQPFVSR